MCKPARTIKFYQMRNIINNNSNDDNNNNTDQNKILNKDNEK